MKKKNYKFAGIACITLISILFFNLNIKENLQNKSVSKEISLHSTSLFSTLKSKVTAASCGFTIHGSPDEFTQCATEINCNGVMISKTGRSQCGGACAPLDTLCPTCNNGATNAPSCNICPSGLNMVGGICTAPCTNGATNPGVCNVCPNGLALISGQCAVTCSTNNPCNPGQSVQGIMLNGSCNPINPINNIVYPACKLINACGQEFSGFTCPNNGCQPSNTGNIDNSCISSFTLSSPSISPNGAVTFNWSFAPLKSGITRKCGFVDLSTPTPRPIPGLQDLSPTQDSVRITNVQRSTQFCLVCKFFGATIGTREAAVHQWVRVIRTGEN
jgi:hypothetical protein